MGNILKAAASSYVSADVAKGRGDLILNIEAIDLPDSSTDLFVLSHVLEHVDDRRALSEINRCLRSNGVALIMVPIVEAWAETYERQDVVSPNERWLHFGQNDHVRYYGRDLEKRIKQSGFDLRRFTADGADAKKYGLRRGETIFIATKT